MGNEKHNDRKRTGRVSAWRPCLALLAVLPALVSCRSGRQETRSSGTTTAVHSHTAGAQTKTTVRTHAADARPQTAVRPSAVASPVVYIYKTRKDYSRLVPVIMDKSRTRIVSYPAPTDLKKGGRLAYPTPLDNGYWLDNRGITPQAAFLSYTYEEYSRLTEVPSVKELETRIVDRQPFTFIMACGRRTDYKDIVKELNEYIRQNGLK